MNRRSAKPAHQGAPPARIAWLVCLAVPLTVLMILGAARATQAHGEGEAPAISAEADLQLGEEEGAGDCFEEAEELETESEEAEEACEEEEEEAAEKCPLRSASAHAATTHTKLKITIGYTTYQPAPARVQIRNSRVETYKRHLGKSGVLRFTEPLTHKQSSKVVVNIESVGQAACPTRRLVLFTR